MKSVRSQPCLPWICLIAPSVKRQVRRRDGVPRISGRVNTRYIECSRRKATTMFNEGRCLPPSAHILRPADFSPSLLHITLLTLLDHSHGKHLPPGHLSPDIVVLYPSTQHFSRFPFSAASAPCHTVVQRPQKQYHQHEHPSPKMRRYALAALGVGLSALGILLGLAALAFLLRALFQRQRMQRARKTLPTNETELPNYGAQQTDGAQQAPVHNYFARKSPPSQYR